MFPISGPMRTLIGSEHYTIYVKPIAWRKGESPAADGFDLTGRLISGTINASMDDRARQIALSFHRGAGTDTLSPLYASSTFNDPSPLIREGNIIAIFLAIMAPGGIPAFTDYDDPGDYILWDTMRIDGWDAAAGAHVDVHGRNLGSTYFIDSLIEEPSGYGSTLAENVIGEIMDEWLPFTSGGPDLPDGASGLTLNPTVFGDISVDQAILSIALLRGWDIRNFPSENVASIAFYDPDRDGTIADATIALSEYTGIEELASNDDDVRNAWKATYDKQGERLEVFAEDSASILQHERRFARIAESETSPIDTLAELQDMVDWALADTKDPYASHRVSTLLWPFVELNDLQAYPANPEHYDAEQKYAVVAYTHEFTASSGRTTMSVRGKPIAAYRRWRAGTTPSVIVSLNDPPAGGYAREGMLWAKVTSLDFPP